MDTNVDADGIAYRRESYEIVGAAMRVWNTLGYGFLEKVYENALVRELIECRFEIRQQAPINVYYRDAIVGEYIADIVVNGAIILELKAQKRIEEIYVAQTINYLKATGLKLGIILNFAPNKLESKRLVV